MPPYLLRLLLSLMAAGLLLAGSLALPAAAQTAAAQTAAAQTAAAQTAAAPADAPTTIILVRHAEKADDEAADPSLSAAGQARAEALQEALRHQPIDAVYTTQLQRTALTAAPVIDVHQPEVKEHIVTRANVPYHVASLADTLRTQHPGETVLVVGHSNTIPELVEAVSGYPVAPLTEKQYDRLYLVRHAGDTATLLTVRYGAPTP